MKKYLLNITTFLFFWGFSFAQNVNKDIEWVKENTYRIDHVNCPSKDFFGNNLIVDNNGMTLKSDSSDESCSIKWSYIDGIELVDDFLYVFSNEYVGNKGMVLKFYIKDKPNLVYAKYHLNKIAQAKSKYYK